MTFDHITSSLDASSTTANNVGIHKFISSDLSDISFVKPMYINGIMYSTKHSIILFPRSLKAWYKISARVTGNARMVSLGK